MNYKLYAIRVFSCRWEESLAFYRDLVGFPLDFSDDSTGWAQFDLGTACLGLERCDPEDEEAQALVGRFVGVSIDVPDLQASYESLKSKGVGRSTMMPRPSSIFTKFSICSVARAVFSSENGPHSPFGKPAAGRS